MRCVIASALLYINLYTCIALVGLIWTIQIVHYPSFNFIQKENFSNFESFHSIRISLVVVPLMLVELLSSMLLLKYGHPSDKSLLVIALLLLLVIWGITFFISSPIHSRLLVNFDQEQVIKLINTNWYRTIGWTLRSFILIYLLGRV